MDTPGLPPAEKTTPWLLYILECSNGAWYTGITTDVDRRYQQHCLGKGARYTRMHPPRQLLAAVAFDSRSAALKAEYAFKQLTRQQKHRWLENYFSFNTQNDHAIQSGSVHPE